MFLKKAHVPCILLGLLWSFNSYANFASTDFVRASLDALHADFNRKINESNLNTNVSITNLQQHIITHNIGEIFQGGIIFYLDKSQQHGLMASLEDLLDAGIEWRNGEAGDRTVNAKSKGLGSGETNTRLIIAEQTIDDQEGQFAASIAANYQITADGKTSCKAAMTAQEVCFGGWYLPSAYELLLLYTSLKQQGLGDLADAPYWSSSEDSTTEAWLIDFSDGQAQVSEKSNLARIRAIRSF
ncbi:MAG: DUF1566 domain-containing protein [Silvanigrellaceae bacterium]|nr:DUF1566 domain-containing protein [Silvanigrellaceae bacterium]